jgi:hypothetical protein
VCHTEDFLEIFERFGELRGTQMKHIGNLFGSAGLPHLFEGRIDGGCHDRRARHPASITMLDEFHVHVLSYIHRALVKAVIGGGEGNLLKDL